MVGVPAPAPPRGASCAALVLATHPGPTVAVTAVATLLAVAAGVAPGRAALVCAAVLAGQASIGWSNDWLDADRDRAVARADKPVVQGAVAPGDAAHGGARGGRASPSSSRSLLGVVPGLLLLVLVASGWAYNAGLKRTAASVVPYVTGFGALPAGVVAAAPGRRWRRGGWSPRAARWVRPPTWPTSHPISRTTWRPASAACRTGWVPARLRGRSARCCWAARRSCWCSARTGRRRRPAGWAWRSPSPPSSWRPWPGRPRFRRAAFPAIMLLTVLDVVLLVVGGAALT